MLVCSNDTSEQTLPDLSVLSQIEQLQEESNGIKKNLGEIDEEKYIFAANDQNRQQVTALVLKSLQKSDTTAITQEKAESIMHMM